MGERERSPAHTGLTTGLSLLVLPLIVASLLRTEPDAATTGRILGIETVLVAAALVALALADERRAPTARIVHVLVPAFVAERSKVCQSNAPERPGSAASVAVPPSGEVARAERL